MYLVSFADHRGAVAESETALFGDFLLFDNSALGEQLSLIHIWMPKVLAGQSMKNGRRIMRC